MDVTPLVNTIPPAPAGDGIATPKNTTEAAQQFEALLLSQMLRATRTEEDEQDSTSGTMWDMAAQQFSQVLSKKGGLGLSKLITDGLNR